MSHKSEFFFINFTKFSSIESLFPFRFRLIIKKKVNFFVDKNLFSKRRLEYGQSADFQSQKSMQVSLQSSEMHDLHEYDSILK